MKISAFIFINFHQDIMKRLKQYQAQEYISDTMCDIAGYSCNPVSKSPGRTTDKEIQKTAQRPKSKSKKSGYDTPENKRCLLSEYEGYKTKDCPYIKIIDPP